jgi:hypothetical protein
MNEEPKKKSGGARDGAGRKAGRNVTTIAVCVTPEAAEKLKAAAARHGVSRSALANAMFLQL